MPGSGATPSGTENKVEKKQISGTIKRIGKYLREDCGASATIHTFLIETQNDGLVMAYVDNMSPQDKAHASLAREGDKVTLDHCPNNNSCSNFRVNFQEESAEVRA